MRLGVIAAFSFLVFSLSITTQAQLRNDLQTEYSPTYQTLQCPRTNDAVKSLNQKLRDLKNAIKKDAACDPINADITGLTDLVTTQRNDVLALISKGQLEGLSTGEQGKVQNYVQELTVKTSNLIAVITGNDACFDEDKQGNSLEFITSLISEGTKLITVLGGPQIGATAQIAGEVVSGFLSAMQTIKANRRGYDFSEAEKRIAYADSLCSTFEYRKELTTLLEPYGTIERLEDLSYTLESQLDLLNEKCVECQGIISEVQNIQSQIRLTKPQEEITIDDLWSDDIESDIEKKALAVDALYTQRLGTHTYKALKTLSWIPFRIQALADASLKADLGLFDVMTNMEEIESFMVDDEAPNLLKHLIRSSRNTKDTFEDRANEIVHILIEMQHKYTHLERPPYLFNWLPNELYYGQVMSLLLEMRDDVDMHDRAYINSFLEELRNKGLQFKVSTDITNQYCDFFAKANWYRDGVRSQCASPRIVSLNQIAELYANFDMLLAVSQNETLSNAQPLEDPAGSGGPVVVEEAPVVVAAPALEPEIIITVDPAESLTLMIENVTRESDYVTRRNPETEELPPVIVPNLDLPTGD